jgi:hypothetical protein
MALVCLVDWPKATLPKGTDNRKRAELEGLFNDAAFKKELLDVLHGRFRETMMMSWPVVVEAPFNDLIVGVRNVLVAAKILVGIHEPEELRQVWFVLRLFVHSFCMRHQVIR